MIAALVFSPSSFSEWRQWTNSSETSALLFTLSKTHFWIWAYIIAPQTWLYNIQQCRYAKTPRETRRMRASTNHISFLLKRLWLTHLTQSSSNRPASSIFHVNLYFQVLLRKALITKDKSHHIRASSLRCAHRGGASSPQRKNFNLKFEVLSWLNAPSISRITLFHNMLKLCRTGTLCELEKKKVSCFF